MFISLPLPAIAEIAGKSSRTIRRWCQLGFVKGARCSRGGHWKVRVFITEKDKYIARKRARAGGSSFEAELRDRVAEKVWEAVKPSRIPSGFERHKKTPKPTKAEKVAEAAALYSLVSEKHDGEPVELATREKAEELFAASELAEAMGVGASLYPIMEKVREIGFMPISKECFTYLLHPRYASAFLAAGRDPIKTAFYGAALNLLKNGNPCSVAAICRRVGVSRATAYRKNVLDMVALARRDQMGVFAEANETRNAPKRQINRDRD